MVFSYRSITYHYHFSIGAYVKETEIENALKHMVLELERVKRFGFNEEEFNRIKNDMLANNESFLEGKNDWYSSRYLSLLKEEFKGDGVLYSNDWYYNFHKSMIPQITIKEVNTMFNSIYHKDNRALIITAPEKEDFVLPNNSTLLKVLSLTEIDTTITAYKPQKIENELLEEIRPNGNIVLEEDTMHGIKKLELSNGAKVFYKKKDL